jgi:phosphogluconate dehydratase
MTMSADQRILDVTNHIIERSKPTRQAYLERVKAASSKGPHRSKLGCTNLAHGFAASDPDDKSDLAANEKPNLAIINSYNDMLSAHQPFEKFPDIIKQAAREAGGTAQVASGVPSMCDGVTQGEPGMELSLFSRDVIAMSTAIGLSHDMFDAAVYLGVCDKIVPGLTIAALTFGHLPAIFIPAGPMTSGLSNKDKARTRQLYAEGKVGRDELLESESQSYHGPGTCTFYGTANSNQMLMEIMGLHIPGSSFINPGTDMRKALTIEAAKRAIAITAQGSEFTPVGEMIDERSFVNGVIGLHATGGSTNHTMHIVAMAKAAGIRLTWQDISELSEIIPLLARVYPNGPADVNHFAAAGGMGYLIGELLDNGMLHEDVGTVWGQGLSAYRVEAKLNDEGAVHRVLSPKVSADPKVIATIAAPFRQDGGLKVLQGNIGKSVIKVSAVKQDNMIVEAPAKIFNSQLELQDAFQAGELTGDFVAVVYFQGPKANGMPELHKLTPPLGVLLDRGQKVALLTDGRMSGASGKVPAAIHMTPEAKDAGNISRIREGDIIRLDAIEGTLNVLMDKDEFEKREAAVAYYSANQFGMGRELFGAFRALAGTADEGAGVF